MRFLKQLGQRVLWTRVNTFLRRYKPFLIAVVGSSGKSMTQEALAVGLSGAHRVRAIHRRHHEPIDVALSILGAESSGSYQGWMQLLTGSFVRELKEEEPDVVVAELTAHRPGNIDWLAQQLPLNMTIVTAIGSSHLTYFGDKESVAHENLSAVVTLPKDGFAILNIDDPYVAAFAEHAKAHVVSFGRSDDATVHLRRSQRLPKHGFACEIVIEGMVYEVHLPHLIGRHQLYAPLATLAAAHAMGADIPAVINNLQALAPLPGRMRRLQGKRGATILDYTCSAIPEAVMAALETLRSLPAGRKIAILGDMLELGGETQSWHKRVGKQAGEVANIVVLVGDAMRHAGVEAIKVGADVHHFEQAEDVGKWLADYLHESDVILVKGSRSMHMEKVVERLLEHPDLDRQYLLQPEAAA